MKAGDLVKTTGFGPKGSVGEMGIVIGVFVHKNFLLSGHCWRVLFGDTTRIIAKGGLKVVSESR